MLPPNLAADQNPFADPLRFERRVPECAIVIFGANGDLTKRKLLPGRAYGNSTRFNLNPAVDSRRGGNLRPDLQP